ncbi:hypothetical protein [Armatimonas rosea]|uniref:Molybdopterin-guanine dinucleotide biosynthesis protein A n=1 Tax=Armatimonas rosea TaxID=685828 RepID=A0A7W9SLW0_ARMRO|nr:hypothetical protein [Armatimonas rosea]MBB6048254.1 molybdopterin-guanine dinucleotide biosynthesis protein A [Armatimonas rosea]
MDQTQELREVVVFFSYDNPTRPRRLAEVMLAELKLPHLALGVDALTGGCELRLYYHKETLAQVQAYLHQRKIIHDISYL